MGWRQYYILIVSSMGQIIGAGLSTAAGIIIPMIMLLKSPGLSTAMQGFIGAAGLVGIAVGSVIIGRISDRYGYLLWFRISPALIVAGSLSIYFFPDIPVLLAGLFTIGLGVGGGYALDSSYISELLPDKWKLFMVGVAKGSCALGFLGVAVVCYFILKSNPNPEIWNCLILTITTLGVLTLLMRIRWAESPHWLIVKGRKADAEKAAEFFFGKGVTVSDAGPVSQKESVPIASMFRGKNLRNVVLTGIPWACEGVGVYGIGVFLPQLIMALGLAPSHETGIGSVIESLEFTSIVNFFILPGFAIGLYFVRKMNHIKMLVDGFIVCTLGLIMLLSAYILKLPVWVSVLGFVIFEVFLNAGPHLVTYVLPAQIFPVEVRGTGSGIAAMTGKIGAVTGVFLMPVILKTGGMVLVLSISIAVMIAGAMIAVIFGKNIKNVN